MARWQEMLNAAAPRTRPTKVSRNGTVVLAAAARRAAGIGAGDEVVTIPVGPGAVLVERVGSAPDGQASWKAFLDSDENPLRGLYGGDPQSYVDELRGPWRESTGS
jgi:bifunctional DNA-binding transcriptional regulator/antitoxin component of YhaV-PrlF toxin-antitoxin module